MASWFRVSVKWSMLLPICRPSLIIKGLGEKLLGTLTYPSFHWDDGLHIGYLRQYLPKTYFMNWEVSVLRLSSKIVYKKTKTITLGSCGSEQYRHGGWDAKKSNLLTLDLKFPNSFKYNDTPDELNSITPQSLSSFWVTLFSFLYLPDQGKS